MSPELQSSTRGAGAVLRNEANSEPGATVAASPGVLAPSRTLILPPKRFSQQEAPTVVKTDIHEEQSSRSSHFRGRRGSVRPRSLECHVLIIVGGPSVQRPASICRFVPAETASYDWEDDQRVRHDIEQGEGGAKRSVDTIVGAV